MGTAENKAVVQEGLDKRRNKRTAAAFDAEQEAITNQMIDIVNQNARNAEIAAKNAEIKARAEREERKDRKAIKAKIMYILKRNNNIVTNLLVYALLVSLVTTLYVINLMQLWSTITVYVSWLTYTIISIYKLSNNITEITKLKERYIPNV